MIAVLFNWLLIFFTNYPLGRAINIQIRNEQNLVQNVIVGLIINSCILTALAFFLAINTSILCGICCINLLLIFIDVPYYKKLYELLKQRLISKHTFLLFFASIVLAIYSSASSKINDDGLYYTQTIKWLREYGFVHGISNLHVSLGLSSVWHILQSVYIFSDSVYTNDLNGFILLIYTILFVSRIINKSSTLFSITQYVLVLLLSVPFLSAPNPDFPVIVLTAIALDLFMRKESYKGIILMACFSITIKISAILLFFTGFYCLYLHRKEIIKAPKCIPIILLIFSLFVTKNIFQTAYPLYPLKVLSINQLDWKTPEPIIDYFSHGIKSWSYSDQYKPTAIENEYHKDVMSELFLLLGRVGAKGLINKFIFITAFISFFAFVREGVRKRIPFSESMIIMFGVFNFIIWFLFAPQYRFILPVFVFNFSLLLYYSLSKLVIGNYNLLFNFLLGIYSIMFLGTLVGLNLSSGGTSKEIGQIDKLYADRLIYPAKQYAFKDMDSILVNNTFYFHPSKNRYCWNTKLPCMSSGYEKIVWGAFHYRITQRTNNFNDGFSIINQ